MNDLAQHPARITSTHRRSYWGVSIILVVLIGFGLFWMNEEKLAAVPVTSLPAQATPVVKHEPSPTLDDLQTTLINTPIPDHSEAF